jgi:predicted PurR-regulated permease PerM
MARGALKMRRNESSAGGSPVETLVVVAAIVAALYLGRAIAIPIAIAILISFSLGPPVSWLCRHHFSRLPAILAVALPALFAILAFAYVVTIEVGRLADNIQAYETNIETKINGVADALPSRAMLDRGTAFLRKLRARGEPAATVAPAPAARGSKSREAPAPPTTAGKPLAVEIQSPDPTPVDIAQTILGPLVGPISDTALVLLFVVFFLAEKENLRDRVISLAGARDLHRTTMAMDEAGKRVSRYLLMQTLVNSAFGTVIAIGLYEIGLPNAALWGALAAVLRFIPYLGTIGASILPLALAFAVDPGWTMLFWTGGLFLGLEMLTGNVVEPLLYGSSTGLSAVALVVSAIFWTWLWGTVGLLLATPLTVCIAVIGRYVPQLAFLDVLLGNQTPLMPEESFYQRLLAGHPDEAFAGFPRSGRASRADPGGARPGARRVGQRPHKPGRRWHQIGAGTPAASGKGGDAQGPGRTGLDLRPIGHRIMCRGAKRPGRGRGLPAGLCVGGERLPGCNAAACIGDQGRDSRDGAQPDQDRVPVLSRPGLSAASALSRPPLPQADRKPDLPDRCFLGHRRRCRAA